MSVIRLKTQATTNRGLHFANGEMVNGKSFNAVDTELLR